MISPIDHPQPTGEAHEPAKPPRRPEPQTQPQKSGALSHDQVTLTNAGQPNREEPS